MTNVLVLSVAAVFGLGLVACQRPVLSASDRTAASDYLARGGAAHEAGYAKDAERSYRETIRLDSSNVWAFYRLGVLSSNLGRYGAAEAHYRRAMRVDPTFMPAVYELALLQAAAGDYAAAAALLNRAVELAPLDPAARVALARTYLVLGRDAQAASELSRAADFTTDLDGLLRVPIPGLP